MVDSIVDFERQASPYYSSEHNEYRLHVRQFRELHVDPYVDKWIQNEGHPDGHKGVRAYIKTAIKYGGIYLFPWSYNTWNNHQWDPFYLIIYFQEMSVHAFDLGIEIISMSLGPLLQFASNPILQQALEKVKTGDALVALAISELSGGSDVAQIKTKATKTDDGKYYIVNGNKYWITTGHRADYFMTLVRTSDTGRFGVSLLLIPRGEGVPPPYNASLLSLSVSSSADGSNKHHKFRDNLHKLQG
eukprot:99239_1